LVQKHDDSTRDMAHEGCTRSVCAMATGQENKNNDGRTGEFSRYASACADRRDGADGLNTMRRVWTHAR
jgi:hypothetical protein